MNRFFKKNGRHATQRCLAEAFCSRQRQFFYGTVVSDIAKACHMHLRVNNLTDKLIGAMKGKKLPHTYREALKNNLHHVVFKTDIKFSLQQSAICAVIKNLLKELGHRYHVDVIQYHVNRNHMHLLVVPLNANDFSKAMQFFASKLALFCNRKLKRHGTFWADRFFSATKRSAGEIKRAIAYVAGQMKNVNPLRNIYSSLFECPQYPFGFPGWLLRKIGVHGGPPEMLLEVIHCGSVDYKKYRTSKNKPKFRQTALFE